MALFGRNKRLAWVMIGGAICVGVLFPIVTEQYRERIVQVYDPATGIWGRNIEGRFGTWKGYFETAGLREYVLGQGFRQGVARNDMESHSTYVSLITVYGMGGVMWAVISLAMFLYKALVVRRCPDFFLRMVAGGCMWALIAWGIYGIAADAVSSQFPRYILFYLVVLIDRAGALAAHDLAWSAAGDEPALRHRGATAAALS